MDVRTSCRNAASSGESLNSTAFLPCAHGSTLLSIATRSERATRGPPRTLFRRGPACYAQPRGLAAMSEQRSADAGTARFLSGDLLPVIGQDAPPAPLDVTDAEHAIGRRLRRVRYERALATVYLVFRDGAYLTYAARI